MQRHFNPQLSTRVIGQVLAQTIENSTFHLDTVATHSRCTIAVVRNVLEELGVTVANGEADVSKETRLRLAMYVAKSGILREIAGSLGWQEFEMFAEQCLIEAGLEASRDVRVKDSGKLWQIDVVGRKPEMALCIDCKHWKSPSYPSKFVHFANHQRAATRALLRNMTNQDKTHVSGLPIILTLLDPRERVKQGVVLVSIDQLPGFLAELHLHLQDLPLI